VAVEDPSVDVPCLRDFADLEHGILGVLRYRLGDVAALDVVEVFDDGSRRGQRIRLGHDRSIAQAAARLEGLRREFQEALFEAASFEDLPGKWQAALLESEANAPDLKSSRTARCWPGFTSIERGMAHTRNGVVSGQR
jgi:hypothetical protein